MRVLLTGLLVAVLAACGQRQVEVQSAPQSQAEVAVQLENNLSQPVNVYIYSNGNETFVGEVPPSSTRTMQVPGVIPGSTVVLRARTLDGLRTYSRDAMLTGTYTWQVP